MEPHEAQLVACPSAVSVAELERKNSRLAAEAIGPVAKPTISIPPQCRMASQACYLAH